MLIFKYGNLNLMLRILFKFFLFKFINFPIPVEDKSLAIPLIPRQSGLLGVIEISIAFSDLLLK